MKLEGSCHCRRVRFRCEAHAPVPYMHCYCSICRKTAGGGGYAINLGARADTLEVEGREHLAVYQAGSRRQGNVRTSSGQRHFCKHCGSALWLYDPTWPEWVHPHASAIDTPLPQAPERVPHPARFQGLLGAGAARPARAALRAVPRRSRCGSGTPPRPA